MRFRDTLERLVWTVVSAFLGALTLAGALELDALEAAAIAAVTAGLNFVTIVARARLAVLPDPGAGLPGLGTGGDGGLTTLEAALVAGVGAFVAVSIVLIVGA